MVKCLPLSYYVSLFSCSLYRVRVWANHSLASQHQPQPLRFWANLGLLALVFPFQCSPSGQGGNGSLSAGDHRKTSTKDFKQLQPGPCLRARAISQGLCLASSGHLWHVGIVLAYGCSGGDGSVGIWVVYSLCSRHPGQQELNCH